MALISKHTLTARKDAPMADKTASEDIIIENGYGQQVVVVPAGQPVPDNIDELKARTADAGKQMDQPAENKSRASRSSK